MSLAVSANRITQVSLFLASLQHSVTSEQSAEICHVACLSDDKKTNAQAVRSCLNQFGIAIGPRQAHQIVARAHGYANDDVYCAALAANGAKRSPGNAGAPTFVAAEIKPPQAAASWPLALEMDISAEQRPLRIEYTTAAVVAHHKCAPWPQLSEDEQESLAEDYGCYLARRDLAVEQWEHVELDRALLEASRRPQPLRRATINSKWISWHPWMRMDAHYWIQVEELREQRDIDPNDPNAMLALMKEVEQQDAGSSSA